MHMYDNITRSPGHAHHELISDQKLYATKESENNEYVSLKFPRPSSPRHSITNLTTLYQQDADRRKCLIFL